MLFHVYCKGDRKPPFGHRAPGHMVRRFHNIWHFRCHMRFGNLMHFGPGTQTHGNFGYAKSYPST